MQTGFFKASFVSLLASLGTAQADEDITFGLTTTQEASGVARAVLENLKAELPSFDLSYSVSGTSQLLRSLEEGFVPFGITHNHFKEETLISHGHHERTPLFSNDFLLVGPAESSLACEAIKDCLSALVSSEEVFLSRGDQSGTRGWSVQSCVRPLIAASTFAAGLDGFRKPVPNRRREPVSSGQSTGFQVFG